MIELFQDLIGYLRAHKKYWLAPIMIIMVLVGGLIVVTEVSSVGTFIYTLF